MNIIYKNFLYESISTVLNKAQMEELQYSNRNVFYRGCSKGELDAWQSGLFPNSDRDPMPLDFEVIEYSIGDSISDMSEEEVDEWVKNMCSWYDGSISSIRGGLNVTSDLENALGYGKYIIAIKPLGEYCEFSDSHAFIKDSKEVEILGIMEN